jgi:hypothetical protein
VTQSVRQAQRDGLIGFVDRYLEALAVNDPAGLPVSADVRFTENGQALALGKGLWATATSVPEYDYLHVEDPELSQIGWFGVIGEGGRPAVVFVRLNILDGLIGEIETIVRREQPRLYDPANMVEPRTVALEELDRTERSSREALIAAAHRYFDGLEQVDGDMIPVTDGCIRIENGTQTVRVPDVSHLAGSTSALIFPKGVREQVSSGYFSYMDDVRDRRVVAVDEERGLVMLVVVFDHSARVRSVQVQGVGEVELPAYHQVPNSVLIAEVFKVRSGLIEHIEAVLEFVPYGMRTGWEGVAR